MADMRYMGKMKNKYRGISICLIVCLIFLSGCSGNSKPVVYESTTEISYSWWGNDDRHRYTLQALDIFTEQNQGQIEVQANYGSWGGYENKMHIYMRSHNAPDVMQINYAWLSEYADEENGFYNLYDLKDIIHLENYTPEELAYGEMDGKLYAVPISFNTPMFYYNKTIYASYGLEIPKTWDDLFAAAKVMSRDGIYPLGTTKKQLFLMLVAYLEQIKGKESVKADGSLQLTKADIAFMLDLYKRLIDEDVLMPIDSFDRNAFSTGKAAGTLAWISDAANYCTPLEENGAEVIVGDYLQDAAARKFGWCVKPATMYAISATTEKRQSFWSFCLIAGIWHSCREPKKVFQSVTRQRQRCRKLKSSAVMRNRQMTCVKITQTGWRYCSRYWRTKASMMVLRSMRTIISMISFPKMKL